MTPRIFIDTNILLAVHRGLDLIGQLEQEYPQYTPTVLSGTHDELARLFAAGTATERAAARIAQELLKREHLNIVSQSGNHVDDALLAAATPGTDWIATLDKELQQRAAVNGIGILAIKRRVLLRPLKE